MALFQNLAVEKHLNTLNKTLVLQKWGIYKNHLLNTLPKKLQEWYLLSYPEFIKELIKKKIKPTLFQEAQ